MLLEHLRRDVETRELDGVGKLEVDGVAAAGVEHVARPVSRERSSEQLLDLTERSSFPGHLRNLAACRRPLRVRRQGRGYPPLGSRARTSVSASRAMTGLS